MSPFPVRPCAFVPALRAALLALPFAFAVAAPVHAAPPDWTLRFDGAGPLRIGMTVEQARAALGSHLTTTPPGQQATPGCDQIELLMPRGVMVMFNDGVLVRVDEYGTHGGMTEKRIVVGATEAQVLARYPNARRDKHAYDNEGAYLTVRDDQRQLWLRFELSKGRVTQFYAGTPDAVQATQGCL